MMWADIERPDPFCDTCDKPAVWTETLGWLHFADGKPVFPDPDSSGHEVTVKEWSNSMTDSHRAPEINVMEGVLADLIHAFKHAEDAVKLASEKLGDHRVTHEAVLAKHALDNTVRVVKMQIAVARKS